MIRSLSLAAAPASPWRNGGGITRELAVWPPGAGLDDFGWRASVAEVAADGPFSAYAGVDRQIVLLDGAGMDLQAPAWRHRLDRSAAPFAFAGDDAVQATLLAGPVRDFNIMTRRGQWRAEVDVATAAFSTPATETTLLFVLAGHWHLAGQAPSGPGEGWLTDGAGTFSPAGADARCLRIHLRKEAANDG